MKKPFAVSLTKTLLYASLLLMTAMSCTIEKRHYRSGFYIDWHHTGRAQTSEGRCTAPIVSDNSSTPQAIGTLSDTLAGLSPIGVCGLSEEVGTDGATPEISEVWVASGNSDLQTKPKPKRYDIRAKGALASGISSMLSLGLAFAFNVSYPALSIGLVAGVIIFGILAIVLARKFRYSFHNARGKGGGVGMANTGAILAWVSFVMLTGFLLMIAGLVLIFNVILPSF
ncbi:MAG: hypothetical protein JNM00_07580 [Flavobacteriales bacterium]|nr:hypothetical protein [Flavobacteriales bacterium]